MVRLEKISFSQKLSSFYKKRNSSIDTKCDGGEAQLRDVKKGALGICSFQTLFGKTN